MIRSHAEERSLMSWLVMQERVLRLWIEEALADAPADGGFLAELESHHGWLAAQIARLQQNAA
ncbi:hypothetical protein [Hyphococcus luteus]|uniref:Uncharacterized protein n=1 Tax=Hyphococcus luteus TaxID=2058213 RepID=A0A2S7JZW1_9PROT|nr:hypothetical protein [Marinicaulis flavus]PQA85799.1 hypothetical protein CW354_19830 [Marinicaulis flavus]